jgi:hypothetical protein
VRKKIDHRWIGNPRRQNFLIVIVHCH